MRKSIFLAALLCACSGQDVRSDPRSTVIDRSVIGYGACDTIMRLRIDSSFGFAEMADLGQALLIWSNASDHRLCFDVEWVSINPGHEMMRWSSDGACTLYGSRPAWQREIGDVVGKTVCKPYGCAAVTVFGKAEADVFFSAERTGRPYFCSVAVHEIGHVLGLEHSMDERNVMHNRAKRDPSVKRIERTALRAMLDAGNLAANAVSCIKGGP